MERRELFDSQPLWTTEQYKLVIKSLEEAAPWHVVVEKDMVREIAKKTRISQKKAQAALDSMLKNGVVAMRPPSKLARDLPAEVYGPDFSNVICMPMWSYNKVMVNMLEHGALD